MIKRFIPLKLLLVIFPFADSFSQSKIDIKMTFHDAESWVLFEDYKEALPLYQQLYQLYPDNFNIKYRIGQCYLNMPGEKEKAISYLEDAVKNINPKYREGRFRETGAPHDALYYLANAYRINYQLDKALEIYSLFKQNLDSRVYDSAIVNLQIRSCTNAKTLMGTPLFLKELNLGDNINEAGSEYNPVISDDESIMVFSKSLAFYDAILYSTKSNGAWTAPVNLNEVLKVDRDIYPVSLSGDGTILYIYNSENYDGNIFSSKYENGTWSPIIKLNDNINTKYWESHAVMSHDNSRLYFTSNRKNTIGGLDIYVSSRDTSGDWGPAANLGPAINTPYNEETPFLSKDDKILFFSSRGHMNMGGHDIFYSTLLENGEWSVPVNVGYPVNSTDDDLFFSPLNDGKEGYIAKFSPHGFGRHDIYRLEYERMVPQADSEVTIEKPAGENIRKELNLPPTSKPDNVEIPDTIPPGTDFFPGPVKDSTDNIRATTRDSLLTVSTENVVPLPPDDEQSEEAVTQYVSRPESGSVITGKQAGLLAEEIKKSAADSVINEDAVRDIRKDQSGSDLTAGKRPCLWYLWLLAGAGLIFFFILLTRRRKKEDRKD